MQPKCNCNPDPIQPRDLSLLLRLLHEGLGVWGSLVVVFEREQVSNGFKRIPLDWMSRLPHPPPPSFSFRNRKTCQSWPCFEARPSSRQQPMQRESRLALSMQEFRVKNDHL